MELGEVARQVDQVLVAGPAQRESAKMRVGGVPMPVPELTGIDHVRVERRRSRGA